MRKLFCIILLMFFLSACGISAAGQPGDVSSTSEPTSKAVLVAKGTFNKVFRFQDGARTCYFTESIFTSSTNSMIWCTP